MTFFFCKPNTREKKVSKYIFNYCVLFDDKRPHTRNNIDKNHLCTPRTVSLRGEKNTCELSYVAIYTDT